MWLTISLALAQDIPIGPAPDPEPPPIPAARLCADAAEGAEVEVCLKLATQRPEEVDDVSAALLAHIDRRSGPDRELMFALLQLLSEETGVEGTRALGNLADARAVPPLVHAARTRRPEIALAAVDALARYNAGLPYLSEWLLDDSLSIDVRIRSAQALGRLETEPAGNALVDGLRTRGLPLAVRSAMIHAVEVHHAHRRDEIVPQISRDGTPWITSAGAVSLGYAMAVVGRFSQPQVAGIGAFAGTVAGGTVSYLAAQAFPIEAADGAFIAVNGLVGTGAGLAIGAGLFPGDPDAIGWAGLVGEAGGLLGGLVFFPLHDGQEWDSIEATVFGLAAAGVLAGTLEVGARNGLSDPDNGRSPQLIGLGIGLASGTAFGHLIAPNVRFEGYDYLLIGLATGVGAGLGTFAPLAGNERGALPAVGAAAGLLAGLALAGTITPDLDALSSGGMGAVYGGLVAGGIAEWAGGPPQLVGGMVLTGGVVGLGLGGLLADLDQDPIDDRDVAMMAYTTGWAAATTAGVQQVVTGDALNRAGPLLVIPAIAGAGIAAIAPVLDVPVTHSSAAVSLGLMGGYVGGSATEILSGDPIPGALIGANTGLLTGALLVSPFVGLAPTTAALADTGGILVGASGLAIARIFTNDGDFLLVGSLIGAGIGFAGGIIAGSELRRSGTTRNIALTLPRGGPEIAVLPAMVPGRDSVAPGIRLEVRGW